MKCSFDSRFSSFLFSSLSFTALSFTAIGKLSVVALTVMMFLVGIGMTPVGGVARGFADEATRAVDYQVAVAERIRRITGDVLASVVSIEVIGVMQSDGEVRLDAPTTGVIVDADGHIIASSWVTQGEAASIIVTTDTGTRFPATVVGRDEHRELVLLKINPKDTVLSPLRLNVEAPTPPVGSTLVAVARYGQSAVPMVSSGVMSASDRLDGTAIQSDVRISPVFYGGPLLDLSGNVAGIVIPAVGENGADDPTAWYDSGIAFAVPSDVIAAKLDRLRQGETIQAGLLGFVIGGADPYAPGTTISTVRKRSPAERAGLKSGDELIEVGGRKVRRRQEVKLALGRFDAGEEVAIRYRRDGDETTVNVTLVETIEPLRPQSIGITLNELKVTSVLEDSPADGVLKVGDVLRSLDEGEIEDAASLRQRLWAADPETEIQFSVARASDNVDAQDKATKPIKLSMTPQSWAGPIGARSVESLPLLAETKTWKHTELRLPDVSNQAVLWHPDTSADANLEAAADESTDQAEDADETAVVDASSPGELDALLVVLLPPSQRDPKQEIEGWQELAQGHNVAVCMIASEDAERWQLAAMDAVTKVTTAAIKQCGVNPNAVAIVSPGILSGDGSSGANASAPADSMVMAVSLSTENVFHGAAFPHWVKPPAIRLRRDAPMRLLRILINKESEEDWPAWTEAIKRIGCPIQTADQVDQASLLDWCRTLRLL
ncbi:serine protease, S1-C subfamily, contains C-terminal PDZ domain [Neorhodopirellula lusitana]|uniref:Serine protease, S1-C subfamily, contains C-terminal PDZ domain n=1 Tax=Neorhodopirellula lusitana TaxID=445327 RepID=A0ABY1PQ50_9BACT|nr:PDZ domain-containing protein [Neorhodopirellula lusitana]SMP40530.1 serine protease, S1-C subfamily, contains C-terminal PDZ domain [Neorhodopirellula lusitana]